MRRGRREDQSLGRAGVRGGDERTRQAAGLRQRELGHLGNMTVNGSYALKEGLVQSNCDSSRQRRSALPSMSREHDGTMSKRDDHAHGGGNEFGTGGFVSQYATSSQRYLHKPPYAIQSEIHISETELNVNLDKKIMAVEAVRVDG